MSTRCQILVDGHSASIYRHSDGYPDGVLHDLLPLVREFTAVRGNDPEYLSAQIVHHLVARHRREIAQLKKGYKDRGETMGRLGDELPYLGYGVEGFSGTFHGDEAYIYVVKQDHVEVRETVGGFGVSADSATLANTKVIRRVGFDGAMIVDLSSSISRVRRGQGRLGQGGRSRAG